jgi:alpha/beta superfamily hydrolase
VHDVQLTTVDGARLHGDLALPGSAAAGSAVAGGAVVCHPHPAFGGDRTHPIVDALFRRLPAIGYATLRFDFRVPDDDLTRSRDDLTAALDDLAGRLNGPLVVVGYSFGAAIALTTAHPRLARLAAIAPPASMLPATGPTVPTLVLTPRHDQFGPPASVAPVVGGWHDATFETIESADHFLHGHAAAIADRVSEWLVRTTGS